MTQTTELRNYRASFILDTRNNQEPVEAVIDFLKQTVEGIGGTVSDVENLGLREFARVTDRKFPAGIYVRIRFDGPASSASVLAEKLRLDRRVNRIMVESV